MDFQQTLNDEFGLAARLSREAGSEEANGADTHTRVYTEYAGLDEVNIAKRNIGVFSSLFDATAFFFLMHAYMTNKGFDYKPTFYDDFVEIYFTNDKTDEAVSITLAPPDNPVL